VTKLRPKPVFSQAFLFSPNFVGLKYPYLLNYVLTYL